MTEIWRMSIEVEDNTKFLEWVNSLHGISGIGRIKLTNMSPTMTKAFGEDL